jgi:hypothetical protein
VADRKSFLLRIDPAVLDAVQRWANDDLRSLNAHIEYLLRDALRQSGRAARPTDGLDGSGPDVASSPADSSDDNAAQTRRHGRTR